MKRAFVTGASGFIGSHLVGRLERERCLVTAFVHGRAKLPVSLANVTVAEGDVEDPRQLKDAANGCDTVFHLAGRAHAVSECLVDTPGYDAVNVDGTRNVLEAAIAGGAQSLVYFSSVKAIGEESTSCLDESTPPRPVTPYGQSKLAAERLVLDCGKRTGMHVVCLRLPMVYGPGNKGNLFRMISAIDYTQFPPVSNIRNRRSMVHVTNVVDAALLAATHPSANGQTYIVTDGRPYSTGKLYELISRALGKPVPRWSVPLPVLKAAGYLGDGIGLIRGKRWLFDSDALAKLTGDAWYSSGKISLELGYQPKATFEDALPELISWYRETQARPTC